MSMFIARPWFSGGVQLARARSLAALRQHVVSGFLCSMTIDGNLTNKKL